VYQTRLRFCLSANAIAQASTEIAEVGVGPRRGAVSHEHPPSAVGVHELAPGPTDPASFPEVEPPRVPAVPLVPALPGAPLEPAAPPALPFDPPAPAVPDGESEADDESVAPTSGEAPPLSFERASPPVVAAGASPWASAAASEAGMGRDASNRTPPSLPSHVGCRTIVCPAQEVAQVPTPSPGLIGEPTQLALGFHPLAS